MKLEVFTFLSSAKQSRPKMAATLESYLNRMVSIITADGRNFVGTLKGFDQTVNLILDDTHERVFSSTNGVEQVRYQYKPYQYFLFERGIAILTI